MSRKRLVRLLLVVMGLILVTSLGLTLWVRGQLRASLPVLDGERTLAGLSAPVEVERDALGVPTLRGRNRLDVARALGFVHAQERFFQMDLLRRQAAGELSELFGAAALGVDQAMRVHRFRAVARSCLAVAGNGEREGLEAYASGVNAGLAALEGPPPEYVAARLTPTPWQPEDSILVTLAMYHDLQGDDGRRESAEGLMADLLPAELVAFLTPWGSEWDAPIVGDPWPEPPLPGPDVLDLRQENDLPTARLWQLDERELPVPGSNNWAVAGSHTADGRALVANDMHLGLGLPNVWFRVVMTWDESGETRRLAGVTLPGGPYLVAGSNGDVAWGFTNSQGDWSDLVIVEVDPDDPDRYRTLDGWATFVRHEERIEIRDEEPEVFEVVETVWGPLIDRDHRDRPRALKWTAHELDELQLSLAGLERARTLEEALDAGNRTGIPAQNLMLADRQGRIAWSLAGPIPRREGCDGRRPSSWAAHGCRWDGWLTPEEYPRVVDPPSGKLWTANNRVVDGAAAETLGNGGWALGARARQIRDGLRELDRATPADLLAIQLDDRALFLERWRELLLELLDDDALAGNPRRAAFRDQVQDGWTGRASVDSVGYRLVRGYRRFLAEQVFEPLTAPCTAADDRFRFLRLGQWEGPLWRLVTDRPPHLLAPGFAGWQDQLLAAVDETLDYFDETSDGDLARRTWGEYNTVVVQHPLSRSVPRLSSWLDAPPEPLPGDSNMPRVQTPTFGASERFVVSPGGEEQGIFHMPGGQSGHLLSPFYLTGHEAWASGEATPFLPGAAEHRLTLRP